MKSAVSRCFESDGLSVCVFVTDQLFGQNAYLITDNASGEQIIVDPGRHASELVAESHRRGSGLVKTVILTHGHFDHIGGAGQIQRAFSAPVVVHDDDVRLVKQATMYCAAFATGENGWNFPETVIPLSAHLDLTLGKEGISTHHTPGHTLGSVFIEIGKFVFSGDTIFLAAVGRTDLPHGDRQQLLHFADKALTDLDDKEMILFPGHGREWSVGEARCWLSSQPVGKPAEFDMFKVGEKSR